MSELLLGYNIFETAQPEKTIENILEMPFPIFPKFARILMIVSI